jgi:integrative and conjugative element protein (TIGR02256 family)
MNGQYQITGIESLVLTEDVMSALRTHIQTKGRKEAGGILLGTVYPGERVIIQRATTPGPLDKAGFYFFDRSRKRAQRVVNKLWKKSAGLCIYLGEWHTHPELNPSPSSRDRRMIRNMLAQTKMEVEFLFLIIVGIESIWIGIENGKELRRLHSKADFDSSLRQNGASGRNRPSIV